MINMELIWQQCLFIIKEQVSENEFNTWLKQLHVRYQDNKIQVIANNRIVHDIVSTKYWSKIQDILSELSGNAQAEFIVDKSVAISKPTNKVSTTAEKTHITEIIQATTPSNSTTPARQSKPKSQDITEQLHLSTKLNKNYTFDTLVRGNSNQLAYAIAMHVTQEPGNKNHNPLFIYGGVGLGKTHLMQSIGNEMHKINPKARIRYLHANDYINDVVQASIRHSFDDLKKYYNSLDLLLMDDIQFIAGDKTKTQEEFFYTFNNLLEKNKQIIMTCDTYPRQISHLNDRLISRFSSGLTVEVSPPELEMRVAILKQKSLLSKIDLDDEIAFFIAQNIKSNVRELEGALNKVLYHAKFSKKGLTIGIAKEALIDIIAADVKSVSVDDIQKTVCDFYKMKLSELLSTKRTHNIVRPRQMAMALTKELTQLSLPSIGNAFGGRDHATVIHSNKTIANLRSIDQQLDRDYNLLIQMLKN